MKIDDIKLGDEVYDGWYPEWGIGKVIKVYKTTVWIRFPKDGRDRCIYDKAHVRYLERKEDFFKEKTQDILRQRGCTEHAIRKMRKLSP